MNTIKRFLAANKISAHSVAGKRCGRKWVGLMAQMLVDDEPAARIEGQGLPTCGRWCV